MKHLTFSFALLSVSALAFALPVRGVENPSLCGLRTSVLPDTTRAAHIPSARTVVGTTHSEGVSIPRLLYAPAVGQLPAVAAPTSHTVAGNALFGQNRFKEARTAYEETLNRAPSGLEHTALQVGLIRTLLRLDDWTAALHTASQAVQDAPDSADARAFHALTLIRAGQLDAARGEAARSLSLAPDSYWPLLAVSRIQAWDYAREAARVNLRRAIALFPDRPDAWFELAEVSGDEVTQQDFEDVQHYLQLKPKGHPHDLATEALPSRVAFMREFLHDQPYHALRPIPEASLSSTSAPGVLHVTTPIERADQYVVLPARVNGQVMKLLFDTGGGFSLTLKKKAADRLKLPVLAHSIVRGVNGKEPSILHKGREMAIGDLVLGAIPLESVKTDVGPGDGVFGVTNLDKYAVTLDFDASTLTLARGGGASAPAPKAGRKTLVFPFHYADSNVFLPATVEGRTIWMLVDTGADADAIFSLRLARELALKREKGSYTESVVSGKMGFGTSAQKTTLLLFRNPVIVVVGAGEAAREANTNREQGADGLKSSTQTQTFQPAFGASPLDTQVSPAMSMEIGGILGIGWIAQARRVTFDYPRRLLTMELPAKTNEKEPAEKSHPTAK